MGRADAGRVEGDGAARLIEGVLPAKGTGLVYAASGACKTFLVLDIGGDWTGTDWHGTRSSGPARSSTWRLKGTADWAHVSPHGRSRPGYPWPMHRCTSSGSR